MPRHWTAEERETLQTLVADGVKIIDIGLQLTRSCNAISREANKLGYGTETINSEKVLYEGVNRRNRTKEADEDQATTNSLTSASSESLIENSDDILADSFINNNGVAIEATIKAVAIFLENDLSWEPKLIKTLTEHIINTQGGAL